MEALWAERGLVDVQRVGTRGGRQGGSTFAGRDGDGERCVEVRGKSLIRNRTYWCCRRSGGIAPSIVSHADTCPFFRG